MGLGLRSKWKGRRGEYCGRPSMHASTGFIRKNLDSFVAGAESCLPRRPSAVLPPSRPLPFSFFQAWTSHSWPRRPPLGGGRLLAPSLILAFAEFGSRFHKSPRRTMFPESRCALRLFRWACRCRASGRREDGRHARPCAKPIHEARNGGQETTDVPAPADGRGGRPPGGPAARKAPRHPTTTGTIQFPSRPPPPSMRNDCCFCTRRAPFASGPRAPGHDRFRGHSGGRTRRPPEAP